METWWSRLLRLLYGVLIGWLLGVLQVIGDLIERRRTKTRLRRERQIYTKCQVIPPEVYKRPDPLIYSQPYLLAQGLAVTWDNPDIQIYEVGPGGVRGQPISSHLLKPETIYEIEATIYNGSPVAPAIDMPVQFSYLSFGMGTQSHLIGTIKVDLPVLGGAGHPVKGSIWWTTPAAKGHYCIQVLLIWNDDANPANNLGQENVDVGVAASPAKYPFAVGNTTQALRRVRFEADTYTLGEPAPCERDFDARKYGHLRGRTLTEDERQSRAALSQRRARRHLRSNHPVPEGWRVRFEPEELELRPGEEREVTAYVTPPDGWTGRQAVNVNGFDQDGRLVGGVTLHTERR